MRRAIATVVRILSAALFAALLTCAAGTSPSCAQQANSLDPPGGGLPISLDVQGADVKTVLRSIAQFGNVNIVPDVDVAGAVSIRIEEIPWRRALDVVCNSAGLVAVESGGVLRVATKKALMEEELEKESTARKREELVPLYTQVYPVHFANAGELKATISFVLSKRGSAEVDPRTNTILVNDIQDRLDAVSKLVAELDTETVQVEIIAKLVDLDITASRQMGILWNLNNLHSTEERMSGSIAQNTTIASSANNIQFGMVRNWMDFDAELQLLERENKANIISNPSITTVNNREARILVGKEIPLIVLDEAGNPITELKKVGITLAVTAHINSDNQITLDLHPEVSDLSSQATVQGGIVFTTAEADTRVMVRDGETAVIGGLVRTNETKFTEGVPIIKDIPLLGRLFESSDTRKDRRELMIFVTPRIVRGMASNETK